jgi:hypothetical protein
VFKFRKLQDRSRLQVRGHLELTLNHMGGVIVSMITSSLMKAIPVTCHVTMKVSDEGYSCNVSCDNESI